MGILEKALHALAEDRERDMRFTQSLDIAAAYDAALENAGAASAACRDASELPFSKDAIKHALVMLLKASDDAAVREPLKIGYLRLAAWQAAGESTRVPVLFGNSAVRGNPLALAQQLAASKDPAASALAASRAEQRSLLEELRRLDL